MNKISTNILLNVFGWSCTEQKGHRLDAYLVLVYCQFYKMVPGYTLLAMRESFNYLPTFDNASVFNFGHFGRLVCWSAAQNSSRWLPASYGGSAAHGSSAPGRAVVHNFSCRGRSSLVHVGNEPATSLLGARQSNGLSHEAGPTQLLIHVILFLVFLL